MNASLELWLIHFLSFDSLYDHAFEPFECTNHDRNSVVLVCDRTCTISSSMFFNAILKFYLVLVIFIKAIPKFS